MKTLAAIIVTLFTYLTMGGFSPATPTPSITLPLTAFTGEVVLIDARASTNVSTSPQSDGSPSARIDFGDGLGCELLACGHAYLTAGTYVVTLTGKGSNGETANASRQIVVSDIPAGTTQTLTDSGNATTNASNLQAAINTAAAANTAERTITMPSGFVAAGPIEMPVPIAGKYITLAWASLATPANSRVAAAGMANAPTITAPSSGGTTSPALRTPATAPSSPPHHYRIQGIHFRKDDETKPLQSLLSLGTDSGGGQTTVAKIAHHFIVERCWFDGGSSSTSQVTNGIRVYADYVTIKDSLIAEFRLIGAGVDAAAISLSAGQGPYAFWNNTMVATSENFNIAGGPTAQLTATVTNGTTTSATLSTTAGLAVDADIAFTVGGLYNSLNTSVVRTISGNNITFDAIAQVPNGTAEWAAAEPSFIEFRRNYLYKPLSWRPSDPSWNGVNYQIKNLWEAKWGRYLVVEGNVFTQTWVAEQTWAIVFTVRNRSGGEVHSASIRQLQWSNNLLKDTPTGYNISAKDDGSDQGNTSARSSDFTFRNNLHWNTGLNWDPAGASHAFINLGQAETGNRLKRIFIIHNTHDNGVPDNAGGVITDFAGGPAGGADQSMWLNNVHQDNGFGFRSNSSTTNSAQNITNNFPPGTAANWSKNLIVNPNNHIYPDAAVMLSAAWSTGVFIDYAHGDFRLKTGSPGINAATDGTDIGVNITVLQAAIGASSPAFGTATIRAITGDWVTAVPTPTPTPATSFTITGTDAVSGAALPGVTMRLLRASDRSLITSSSSQSDGTYSLSAGSGLSVIVSPSASGYTFSPSEVLYSTINSNKTQNFAAVVVVAPTPTPTPLPSPSPSPSPTATPTPGICRPNELLSSGCTCLTKPVGPPNARRCKP